MRHPLSLVAAEPRGPPLTLATLIHPQCFQNRPSSRLPSLLTKLLPHFPLCYFYSLRLSRHQLAESPQSTAAHDCYLSPSASRCAPPLPPPVSSLFVAGIVWPRWRRQTSLNEQKKETAWLNFLLLSSFIWVVSFSLSPSLAQLS